MVRDKVMVRVRVSDRIKFRTGLSCKVRVQVLLRLRSRVYC